MGEYKAQHISSATLTVAGSTTGSAVLSLPSKGEVMAAFIHASIGSPSYNTTIKDSRGFDILRGFGTGITSQDAQINSNIIGGQPADGELTVEIVNGGSDTTFDVYLYIKGTPSVKGVS